MIVILDILLTLVKRSARAMKQISQETFDEMVEENIDAFELEVLSIMHSIVTYH